MGVGTTHGNTGKQREQEYWGLSIKQNQELYLGQASFEMPIIPSNKDVIWWLDMCLLNPRGQIRARYKCFNKGWD